MLTDNSDSLPGSPEHSEPSNEADVAARPAAEIQLAEKRNEITLSLVFEVDSVEKIGTPGGAEGHDWYRYVLKNRRSTINGLRRGSRQHVCAYAAQYAEQLNLRIAQGSNSWQPRNNKAGRTR